MSRRAQPFTQTDVTNAVMGAVKAGLNVHRYEIDREGKIVVYTGKQPKHPNVEDATALIG
jgi:hypothetical protein